MLTPETLPPTGGVGVAVLADVGAVTATSDFEEVLAAAPCGVAAEIGVVVPSSCGVPAPPVR